MEEFSLGDLVENEAEGVCIVCAVSKSEDSEQVLRVYNSKGVRLPVGDTNWYAPWAFRLVAKSQKSNE